MMLTLTVTLPSGEVVLNPTLFNETCPLFGPASVRAQLVLRPVPIRSTTDLASFMWAPGGAGNFVKMVHNGIEYGDMQLISEAYDVLHTVGGLDNDEIADVFVEWNKARAAMLEPARRLGRRLQFSWHLPTLWCRKSCTRD